MNEKDVELLMLDKCTRAEAEKHLKNGAIVFEDLEENFDVYMQEWGIDEEGQEAYKKMIDEKIPMLDWGIVEKDEKAYYIMYAL